MAEELTDWLAFHISTSNVDNKYMFNKNSYVTSVDKQRDDIERGLLITGQ